MKPAETVTYGYDLQGRVTDIDGKFSQSLQYDYVGNIKAMRWSRKGFQKGYSSVTWDYAYDALDRLTKARAKAWPAMQVAGRQREDFREYTYKGYDHNGNLTEVQLKLYQSVNGIQQAATYDVREMYYNGNQLRAIARRDTPDKPMGVIRPTTCWYDGNGNLVKDLTRNISRIEYNPLNLPTEVTLENNGGTVAYCYSSDGRKLRAVKSVDGKRVTNDYIGNVVYENGRSKLLLFDGGYFDCEDAGYHFYVKDYLGNNWAVVAEDGTVEEFNLYTPFGDLLYREGDAQPYKYNAKELEKELGWYDYGARFYHPQALRFTTMDPMAEQYYAFSPYAYCGNNPVRFVDPDGKRMNPIYSVNGDFLGTDDEGLQGEPIVMEKSLFTQNMSHEDAEFFNMGIEIYDNFTREIQTMHYEGLKKRPDYDGYLSCSEAVNWYRHGNGQDLYVDISKIDISPISTIRDVSQLKKGYYNFFGKSGAKWDTQAVYGSIKIRVLNSETGEILLGDGTIVDEYDFDMQKGRPKRNVATWMAKSIVGSGTDFTIYGYGHKTIRK